MTGKLREQLANALRAECAGGDLLPGPFGMHVYAKRADGSLYELGSVSYEALYQSPEAARQFIERLKFGHR